MHVLSVVALKGGVGKSTIATAIASELAARGRRVLLADTDEQATAQAWGVVATGKNKPRPTVTKMLNGFHRDSQLPALAAKYDWTLVDTPPHAGPIMRAALMVADIALLPTIPGAADAWALGETITVVRDAQQVRKNLRAAIVLNRVARHTALGAGARAAIGECGLPILKTELGVRVAYSEALAAGLGPTSYAPTSPAAEEIRALVNELERLGRRS